MPASRPPSPSRRFLLLGALATPLAAATVTAATAAPAQTAAPRAAKAECLADLIESGEVTRADLVAR